MPKVFVQPKLNGERCRVISKDGVITLLSSEENEFVSVPHINFELSRLNLPDFEKDGELYIHGKSLQYIHSIVSRKKDLHPEFETMELHLFDAVTPDFQLYRLNKLKDVIPSDNRIIKLVPTYSVDATETDVYNILDSVYKDGYEGIIVRNPAGLYSRKRSTDIMKFKPRKADTYKIIGYEQEISKDGVPKQSLGALWLSSDEGQRFKVGSGRYLTRENREVLWAIKDRLPGMFAEILYQNLTDRRVPYSAVLMNVLSIQQQDSESASGVEA